MAEKKELTDALDDIVDATAKHGGRYLVHNYGPHIVLTIAGLAAVKLTYIASGVRREAAIYAAVFFVALFVGLRWILRRRPPKATKRSPEMQALIDDLTKRARGEGQSVAEAQLRAGFERASHVMASWIASQRGTNAALAQREAVNRGSEMLATANRDAAELRAKEIADAQRQLAEILVKEEGG